MHGMVMSSIDLEKLFLQNRVVREIAHLNFERLTHLRQQLLFGNVQPKHLGRSMAKRRQNKIVRIEQGSVQIEQNRLYRIEHDFPFFATASNRERQEEMWKRASIVPF